jgi:GNAT superfamily N-acetyltransferase
LRAGWLTLAAEADAAAIAALRNAVATDLTRRFGIGHWSSQSTERGVRSSMKRESVYVVRDERGIVATLTLVTKKPWAIDRRYFTPVRQPLYLTSMAVVPERQGSGIGRTCLAEAVHVCRNWPAQTLCLDAYDTEAGAGDFYRKCGFTEVGRATYKNTPLIYYEMLLDRASSSRDVV